MSVAQVIDASPRQAGAIDAQRALLLVSRFLELADDNDHMVFAQPLGALSLSNSHKVIVRDHDDVSVSMRAHMEAAFDGGPEAAYHKAQYQEELEALKKRAECRRSLVQVAPMYLIDA